MDVLDRFNLLAQVDRASSEAQIHLSIDSTICPGRHRYEVQITPERAVLVASDATGLFYALQSFLQLLQLHSDVQSDPHRGTIVAVPPVTLNDWPDVPSRGVLWAYGETARASVGVMRDNIELLSR
jgi:N-acetyl-beta-hexosaminidase